MKEIVLLFAAIDLLLRATPPLRDFRVKMWGTSSPTDKLAGDLGNVIEAAQIGVSSVGSTYDEKNIAG